MGKLIKILLTILGIVLCLLPTGLVAIISITSKRGEKFIDSGFEAMTETFRLDRFVKDE